MSSQLKIIALITYIELATIPAYLKSFPVIINPLVSDLFFALLVVSLIALLTFASISIKTSRDVYYVLPQIAILTCIAAGVSSLRIPFPALRDPYYYLITNLKFGSASTLQSWSPLTGLEQNWPGLFIFTNIVEKSTSIDSLTLLRFLIPTLSLLLPVFVFVLARSVTNDDQVALLASLIGSIADPGLFYMSEYHPQGLALIFFPLFVFLYIKYRSSRTWTFLLLLVTCAIFIVFTHHFSSLFLGIFAISCSILFLVTSHWLASSHKFRIVARQLQDDYRLWLTLGIILLAYHVIGWQTLGFGTQIGALAASFSPVNSLITAGPQIPLFFTIASSTKWIVLFLALISIVMLIRTPKTNEVRCAVLLICALFAGILGAFVIPGASNRIIAFYLTLAAMFSSLTLVRFRNRDYRLANDKVKVFAIVVIVLVPVSASFFDSQGAPAYFFHTSEVNTFYYNSNDLSSVSRYEVAGGWIRNYTPNSSTFGVQFDTNMIPLYFGHRPDPQITNFPNNVFQGVLVDYVVVNPSIPYDYQHSFNKTNYLQNHSIIYQDGAVVIAKADD